MDQQRKIVRAAPGMGVRTESGSPGGGVEPTNFGSNAAMAAQVVERGGPSTSRGALLSDYESFYPERHPLKKASCDVVGASRNFYESPWEGSGGATLITTSQRNGSTKDAFSGSRQFLASRMTREDETSAWQHAVTADINKGGAVGEVGDTHAPVTGDKTAVLVGNSDYVDPRMNDLPSVPADVAGMGGYYSSQGFRARTALDQSSSGMAAAFTAGLASAKEGDHVVLFYAGHGSTQGLQGVEARPFAKNDVLSYGAVTAAAQVAVQRGFQLTMVLDSCNSDVAQEQMTETVEASGKAAHINPLSMNVHDEAQNWTKLQQVSKMLGGVTKLTTEQYQWLLELQHGLRSELSGEPRGRAEGAKAE